MVLKCKSSSLSSHPNTSVDCLLLFCDSFDMSLTAKYGAKMKLVHLQTQNFSKVNLRNLLLNHQMVQRVLVSRFCLLNRMVVARSEWSAFLKHMQWLHVVPNLYNHDNLLPQKLSYYCDDLDTIENNHFDLSRK